MTKKTHSQFLFTKLSAENLAPSKWFDGLVAGKFVDMLGRSVTFKSEEFEIYLSNTKAAIDAATAENGEVVGLPIDANGPHDGAGGAGWIVDIQLASDGLLRLLPRWTKIGEQLISENIRRFFSAEVDTINKVIVGGSLTNRPAMQDSRRRVMLRPIVLSQAHAMFELAADESLDEKASAIRRAFYTAVGEPASEPYICDGGVFDGYVIVRAGEKLFRVEYTQTDDTITFQERAEWVDVKPAFVEAALSWVKETFNKILGGRLYPKQPENDEETMAIKLSELSAADRAELLTQLAAQLHPPAPGGQTPPPAGSQPVTTPTIDLSALFNLSGMTAAGRAQLEQWGKDQAALLEQQVQLQLTANLAQVQRANRYTELSQRLTGGSTETPRGIKGVTAEELKKRFLSLSDDDAKFWGGLLETVVKGEGLVEFSELGHSKMLEGTVELAAPYAKLLTEWVTGGQTIEEFFSLNARELGEMKNYNLSAFKPKA